MVYNAAIESHLPRKRYVSVNNKERYIPHRSHSEAVNRRRILAIARRTAVLNVDARILEKNQARDRLAEIDQYLSPDDQTLSMMTDPELDQTRTGLEIERTWLQLKLGIITPAEKEQSLAGIFEEVEKNKPEVSGWLNARNEHGLSMKERIRDKVMPPIRVAGYYTKR